jgi:hypothetical protein
MIVESIDSEIRFFGASEETQKTNGRFDTKQTGQTLRLQNIH